MEAWQALCLGVVEGLTEFLPVSSTGHLLIAQRLLGIPVGEGANAFAIVIQGGAILAVLGLYRGRAAQILRGLLGRDPGGARLGRCLLAAFAPAALLGLAFDDWIEARLFGPWTIVWAWIVGGLALVFLSRWFLTRPRGLDFADLALHQAVVIGLFQCLALVPGTSRSLAALLGGLLAGLSLAAAVEFSFLLGVVTLSAASAYKLLDSHAALRAEVGAAALVAGSAAACFSAFLAVRWMAGFVVRRGLAPFGYYRLVVGLAAAAWLWTRAA